jgi:hypothetical protein
LSESFSGILKDYKESMDREEAGELGLAASPVQMQSKMLHKALNDMFRHARRELVCHMIFLVIFIPTSNHLEEQLNSQLIACLKEGSCAPVL